jgi:probable HAF family extracellular repeat protein
MKSALICTLCVLCIARHSAGADFVPLGQLPGGGASSAQAVSADGSVVVGSACVGGCALYLGLNAFRWTSDGGMVSIGGSFASDVSADGSVVVGGDVSSSGVSMGDFRWTESSGLAGIGLSGAGLVWDVSVSADGAVVVGQNDSEAYRWTSESGAFGLGDLFGGDFSSRALDVSADGTVVVGSSSSASGDEAFRWTSDGGMVGLGNLTGHNGSVAHAVSADGSVVVGWSSYSDNVHVYSQEAFRWTSDGGMVGLSDLPGGRSWSGALDVSADGSVVVGYRGSASGPEAFVWDAINGMRSVSDVLTDLGLDMTGWTLGIASAISANATTIVGEGRNALGEPEAWLAKISVVPEPSTSVLTGLVLMSLFPALTSGMARRSI